MHSKNRHGNEASGQQIVSKTIALKGVAGSNPVVSASNVYVNQRRIKMGIIVILVIAVGLVMLYRGTHSAPKNDSVQGGGGESAPQEKPNQE